MVSGGDCVPESVPAVVPTGTCVTGEVWLSDGVAVVFAPTQHEHVHTGGVLSQLQQAASWRARQITKAISNIFLFISIFPLISV